MKVHVYSTLAKLCTDRVYSCCICYHCISRIFMDVKCKPELAVNLTKNYTQLLKNFVADSHNHDVCVSDIRTCTYMYMYIMYSQRSWVRIPLRAVQHFSLKLAVCLECFHLLCLALLCLHVQCTFVYACHVCIDCLSDALRHAG